MRKTNLGIAIAIITGALFVYSCQDERLEPQQIFKHDKTEIVLKESSLVVSTNNLGSDFAQSEIFVHESVEFVNGEFQSKNNENIWFIPFDKYDNPILLSRMAENGITIYCDCSSGTIGVCERNETTNNGVTTIKCVGACAGIDHNSSGTCDMTITIGPNKTMLYNGAIVSSENIIFNNVKYE